MKKVAVAVINTRAGPNIIQSNFIPPEWKLETRIMPRQPRLIFASGESLHVERVMPLYVRLHDYFTLVWVGAVDDRTVDVLLGTLYIKRWKRTYCHKNEGSSRATSYQLRYCQVTETKLTKDRAPLKQYQKRTWRWLSAHNIGSIRLEWQGRQIYCQWRVRRLWSPAEGQG